MDIFSFVKLFGGLGLFIYGMMVMGNALEKIAGEKLERTLESMTGNIFKAVGLGAVVTAIIQSSSATTVMVVGFVNAGIMSLKQAVGVIMGANIGTTMTAQLLRLGGDSGTASIAMQFVTPSNFSYVMVAVGVILVMAAKKKKNKDIGEILLGLGVLFIGMNVMETSVSALRDLPAFKQLFITLKNPVLGILTGTIVTAIIQSSSASVGILQAVASTGAVSYGAAIPIILGQNIGTCITAFMASLGASKNAKRTAMIHFYFNAIGSVIFIVGVYLIKATIGLPFWDDAIDKAAIANFHTLFNVVVTAIFIPFRMFLVKLAEMTIKIEEKDDLSIELARLDTRFYSTPAVALEQCHKVMETMGHVALGNLIITNSAIVDGIVPHVDTFNENETFLDRCEAKINKYMLGIKEDELSAESRKLYEQMIHTVSDFERIGDYTENIFERYNEISESGISFSDEAMFELKMMRGAVEEIVELTIKAFVEADPAISSRIEALEETIDGMREALKNKHLHRLRTGLCTIDVGMTFLDIIHNYEKIADHCSNIAIYVMMYNDGNDIFDVHEYRKMTNKLHEGAYTEWYSTYEEKYLDRVV